MANIKEKLKDISSDVVLDLIKDFLVTLIVPVLSAAGSFLLGWGPEIALILALSLLVLLILGILISKMSFIKNRKLKPVAARMETQLSEHIKNKGYSESFYRDIVFPKIEGEDGEYEKLEDVLAKEKNIEIVATGGAGKTTMLQYVVYRSLANGKRGAVKGRRLPFFIALNKIVNHDGEYFVSETLCKEYWNRDTVGEEAQKTLIKYFRSYPKFCFILLLDGFNELRDEKDRERILADISKLEELPNVKMVLTSRCETKGADRLELFKVTVHGFSEETVKNLLLRAGLQVPASPVLLKIIQNPMMFSIYKQIGTERSDADKVSSLTNEGMLLREYCLCQEKRSSDVKEKLIYRLILPYIGYSMETQCVFNINGEQLRKSVIQAMEFLKEVLRVDRLESVEELLDIDNDEYDEILELTKNIPVSQIESHIVKDLAVIVKNNMRGGERRGVSYSFYHQIFRDFFSALHIYNQTHLQLEKSDLFYRIMPNTIAVYFCQLYGEEILHDGNGEAQTDSGKHIHEIITAVSFVDRQVPGYYLAVRNLFDLMLKVHGGLYGYRYRNLDLSGYGLNGILLSQNRGNKTVNTRIENCRIDYLRFLPQGHLQWVFSIAEIDNDIFVSCGRDGKIKLWNVPLSYCEFTLPSGHEQAVCVEYINGFVYASTSDGFVLRIRITKEHYLQTVAEKQICNRAVIRMEKMQEEILLFTEDGKVFRSGFALDKIVSLADLNEKIITAKYNTYAGKAYVCTESGQIKELNPETGSFRTEIDNVGEIQWMDLNTETDECEWLLVTDTLMLYDEDTEETKRLEYPDSIPLKAVYCENFRKSVAVYQDHSVVLWNLNRETYECLYTHDDVIEDIIVRNGLIITASRDFSIKIYDMKQGEVIDCFKGESYWIRKILHSAKGESLYLPSTDGSIKRFSLKNNAFEWFLFDNDIRAYSICELNGKYLVSALIDGSLSLWDIEKRKILSRTPKTGICMDDVETVGENLFVSINSSNEVFLWSAENGQIRQLDSNTAFCTHERIPGTAVNSIYYMPDHNGCDLIVSLHWTNKIGIWKTENGRLKVCAMLTNAVLQESERARGDWPYCAAEMCDSDSGRKTLIVSSRKGYVNAFSVVNGKNETGIFAKDNYLKGVPSSLYSVITFGAFMVLSNAKGELLVYRGAEKILEEKPHDSRIFILKKTDDSHFISYSEDGKIKEILFSPEKLQICGEIEFVPGLFVKNCKLIQNEEQNTEIKRLVEMYR
ncbi:MAG: NACHT domain-containing protein [Clostridia bacterium]|nr:NACHT domain-containing protein [Clostridia bacterium]